MVLETWFYQHDCKFFRKCCRKLQECTFKHYLIYLYKLPQWFFSIKAELGYDENSL